MYTGCFADFETNEERWIYWSRWAWINRYEEYLSCHETGTFCSLYLTSKTRQHNDCVFRALCDADPAANTFFWIDIGFHNFLPQCYKHTVSQHSYINLTSHNYYLPYAKRVQSIFMGSAPAAVCLPYRTFLFSAPGVVTITFSGIITSAPFAVAAPLNIFSTIALNVSTTAPSVTYSVTPLIW